MKQISYTLIVCLFLFSCAQSTKKEKAVNEQPTNTVSQPEPIICFDLRINLWENDITIIDTTINVRKSVSSDTSIMIVCDTNLISIEMEKMLLKSGFLVFNFGKNCSSILWCKKKGKRTEISQYYFRWDTAKAREIRRYLVMNNKVVGLNFLPGSIDEYEFMSIEEYEARERLIDI